MSLTDMSDMDPALAFELDVLSLQKNMNNVIDRGDSPIQQLYEDKIVFVSGGCGFIGKHLIEKLLRACNVKKIYVLVRPKKGKTIQERIDATLSNPVYDRLRKLKPNFAELIIPVQGDISDIRLGLIEADWKLLTEQLLKIFKGTDGSSILQLPDELLNRFHLKQVNIVFHEAATIRFNEPLRTATITNVRGTREMLQLARECKHLVQFVHVSTCFAQATREYIDSNIFEKFYTCPVPPHALISLAENVEEKKLINITRKFIDGWPNTYAFTKAVAEELVRVTAGDLPICIVRPPMVLSAYYEPSPGWLEQSCLIGPSGLFLGVGMGVIHVINVNISKELAFAPVDLVNNATIASVWDSTERKKNGENDIPIYTVAKKEKFVSYSTAGIEIWAKSQILHTPKALWYSGTYFIKNTYLYMVMSLFLHYIPAFVLDVVLNILGKKPKEITSVVDVYRKFDKSLKAYEYFQSNEFYFCDDNIQSMMKKMTVADQAIFNCDLMTVDLIQYFTMLCMGIRRYILEDGLQGTAEGVRRQNIFKILNYVVCTLYVYIIWSIFRAVYNFLAYILFP